MFAAIQNNRLVYCVENEILCEALARGFETIAELREWEAGLPADAWGRPVLPPAPFEIRRLEGALLEQYRNLEQAGCRPGEMILAAAQNTGVLSESESDSAPESVSIAASPAPAAEQPLLIADQAALQRRKSRAEWDAVRTRRDQLLSQSDKYMLPDFPIDELTRAAYRRYREKLRNITNGSDDPGAVKWPVDPGVKKQNSGGRKKSR